MRRCQRCQTEYPDAITFCPIDGQVLSSFNFDSLVGQVLDGKFRLDAKLGEGAHGVVYRALQLDIERPVALKILHPTKVLHPSLLTQIVDVRDYWLSCLARFRREARAAGRILHPNVVAVTGFGTLEGDIAYLVMEYLEGQSLRSRLKSGPRMEVRQALAIMRQVAWAVESAHREGVIHRDLKPANIFLEKVPGHDNVVKVLDFGIAKLMDQVDLELTSLTDTGIMLGTPRYMSPEQCGGREVAPTSDIYSLGIILYEMLAGEAPFVGPTMAVAIAHETRQPRPILETCPQLAPEIADLVMRCIRKKPQERPGSAAEVAVGIEDYLAKGVIAENAWSTPVLTSSSRIQVDLDFKKPALPATLTEAPLPETDPAAISLQPTVLVPPTITAPIPDTADPTPISSESECTTVIRNSSPSNPSLTGKKGLSGEWKKAPQPAYPTIVVPPEILVPKDMAYVPAGYFQMGSSAGLPNERPPHLVFLDAFFIDKTEVTNAQFRRFCEKTGRAFPAGPRTDLDYFHKKPDFPVINVSWEDAVAYAAWVGKRLPTEAEWEKAARGGLEGKLFPWGDDITPFHANFGLQHPVRVASYFPNAYGVYDMTGNVWEWCRDWYDADYYRVAPPANPTGPAEGKERVLRGGSAEGGKASLRVSFRHWMLPTARSSDIGFRCAKTVGK
ncbi:MAG: SUMF1/EgtB/PvdO family nonheme iron enzyme [Blastocatellia bacterium]|nr:SUMF1/EgtB/PvdO family nonheme iron enzyme [Blastocatellia bacterium]